ncbi:discoidin domain-containing protein [Planctomycetota bacterium]
MCKKVAFFVLVLCLAAGLTNAKPLNQDPGPDGIISVEVEHYDDNVAVGGHSWEETGPTGGFTGIIGMHAPNGQGGHGDSGYSSSSERLDYEIDFVKTGTYYVWILGWGAGGSDDSCNAGLDGEEIPTLVALTGWSDSYEWNCDLMNVSDPPTFEVTTPGVHTFNIWVREDGLIIDKIVLTTNPDFSLSGTEPGPPESTRGPRVIAFSPTPKDSAEDVSRDLTLTWESGLFAATHDVYFGENFDDVEQATATADPAGVYKGSVIPNSYTLPERLEFDRTYYWRIDEVNAAPSNTVHTGDVWSFRTELFAYEIDNVIATASSSEDGKEAANTVNGSGLDPNGLLHGNIGEGNMWLSAADANLPAWIEFEFQSVQKVYEMWVWNSNESLESVIGLGFKDVTIEYSVNGENYTTLGMTHEFTQAFGQTDYAHNTTIDMEGVAAKYVKLTANNNWKSILEQFGLSEVRFFSIPVQAREPDPAVGAWDVELDLNLGFRAGREGVKHDVYFSDDLQAVADGTVPIETVTETSYGPLELDLGTTYFWRVDEVNDVETIGVWPGNIWHFTTQESFVLDDFESYNAEENQIWYAWKDGLGYGTPETPPYYTGNSSGVAVGDETTESFTEESIVHGGNQSMPLAYNNNKQGYLNYSEATMTLSSHRDWTARGVKELSLWFRGLPGSVGSFSEGPVGTYTMTAAGIDIWDAHDEFHFAYIQLSGVGSITARVESVDNTDPWAKAGVMIRETLDPGSKFAAVYITSTNADGTPTQGCRFQARTDTDGGASSDTSVATNEQMAVTAPYWVRLERDFAGNLRGYYSSDGSTWTSLVWRPSISMGSNVYIGLALTSHNPALTGEARFSGVQTTGTVTGQWQSQDIGISSNSAESMYVAVGNSTGTLAVVYHDDPAPTQIDVWTQWTISTQAFADQGVNLTDVDNISVGIGNRDNPQVGGSGTVYIDDVWLQPEPPVLVPKEANTVFEAEAADILGESWRTYHGPTSSGAAHIGSRNGDGDDGDAAPGTEWIATYNFSAPEGVYKILLRAIAPTGDDDSCWVRITTATSQTHEDPDQPGTGWVRFNGIENSNEWLWDEVHSNDHDDAVVNWTLPAGEHTLEIGKREDGTLFDAILITDDLGQTTVLPAE